MTLPARRRWFLVGVLLSGGTAFATVFINEISINPPGSLDDFREFVELQGTPGKKLDGYAIAFLGGTEARYYGRNTIPPLPDPLPEIDEFFSLDGLALGANGLLVLAISARDNYPEVLDDTAFVGPWSDLWNGGLDTPGKFENDGSITVFLVRNRPGQTQARPNHPDGLRWGKAVRQDFEIIRNVMDPQDSMLKDQFGDGDLDEGQPNGFGGFTHDMSGMSTPAFLGDDLEIVDEVSYESERGWEYDRDERKVDVGSESGGLPERRVHALDDPQGFNPDSLTRVDYRLVGPGWPPAGGGLGQMPNGANWQDTATEQWIRGENSVAFSEEGPQIFYDNTENPNPDSVQPYNVNVPRWLADGGPGDYSFSAPNTYRLMAGRLNPLAVPYVPGDVNRDGACDQRDIDRIATVFGDENWLFSNSFDDSPQGNDGDPATQVRPWDVDQTGDNGIEASDLQWVLNFLGSSDGRIRGMRYDSETPSPSGVVLNPNTNVRCTVTTQVVVPSGRPVDALQVGDEVLVHVLGQVTTGAILTAAEANGIMQFVHNATLSAPAVLRVTHWASEQPFRVTREALSQLGGSSGDTGVSNVHGHTTTATVGLGTAAVMYTVHLRAVGLGATSLRISPPTQGKFAASAPRGLKVGRTRQNGDPASATYPPPLAFSVTTVPDRPGDCNGDLLVDSADYACFHECFLDQDGGVSDSCETFDFDQSGAVNLRDFASFQAVFGN